MSASLILKVNNVSNDKRLAMDEQQLYFEHIQQIAKHRSKAAFTALFKAFAPKILALTRKKIQDEQMAQDILQETMTLIWRKAHLFDGNKGQASTWIYTIMRNATFDYLRRLKNHQYADIEDENYSDSFWHSNASDSLDDGFIEQREHQHLASHLIQLNDAQKQVVFSVYFKGLTQEQVADDLAIPVGTVKSRLRLGLAKLKQFLGDHYDQTSSSR